MSPLVCLPGTLLWTCAEWSLREAVTEGAFRGSTATAMPAYADLTHGLTGDASEGAGLK